jgi:hypothetical protein
MPFLQAALPAAEIDCVLTWLEGIEPGSAGGAGGMGGSGGMGGAGGMGGSGGM